MSAIEWPVASQVPSVKLPTSVEVPPLRPRPMQCSPVEPPVWKNSFPQRLCFPKAQGRLLCSLGHSCPMTSYDRSLWNHQTHQLRLTMCQAALPFCQKPHPPKTPPPTAEPAQLSERLTTSAAAWSAAWSASDATRLSAALRPRRQASNGDEGGMFR